MNKLFFYLPTMDVGGAEKNFLKLINFYKKKKDIVYVWC